MTARHHRGKLFAYLIHRKTTAAPARQSQNLHRASHSHGSCLDPHVYSVRIQWCSHTGLHATPSMQAPDVMRSCSMALCLLSTAIGSYLAGEWNPRVSWIATDVDVCAHQPCSAAQSRHVSHHLWHLLVQRWISSSHMCMLQEGN
jgi:hypothetical protein